MRIIKIYKLKPQSYFIHLKEVLGHILTTLSNNKRTSNQRSLVLTEEEVNTYTNTKNHNNNNNDNTCTMANDTHWPHPIYSQTYTW